MNVPPKIPTQPKSLPPHAADLAPVRETDAPMQEQAIGPLCAACETAAEIVFSERLSELRDVPGTSFIP
jgi:hypothetical protein